MKINNLILASSSSHREKILRKTGITFSVQKPEFCEEAVTGEDGKDVALARAKGKAMSVAQTVTQCLVIGCDQVGQVDGSQFSKITDLQEARQFLRFLSDKTHTLHSAFSIVYSGAQTPPNLLHLGAESVKLKVRHIDDCLIDSYLATREWIGTTGCYRIEGIGMHLMEKIEGEQSAIIGLPIISLLKALRNIGIDGLSNPKGPWYLKHQRGNEEGQRSWT